LQKRKKKRKGTKEERKVELNEPSAQFKTSNLHCRGSRGPGEGKKLRTQQTDCRGGGKTKEPQKKKGKKMLTVWGLNHNATNKPNNLILNGAEFSRGGLT